MCLTLMCLTSCSLRELAKFLHEKTNGRLPNDHSKLMYHLMYTGEGAIAMELSKSPGYPIRDTGVKPNGAVVLGVEEKTANLTSDTSVTMAYFGEESTRIDVFVAARINDEIVSEKLPVNSLIKAASLRLLIEKIGKELTPKLIKAEKLKENVGFVVRECLDKKGCVGCIFKDEAQTLAQAGLSEPGTFIVAEYGAKKYLFLIINRR